MNIFVIDRDPYVSAQHLPDRHVTKMILECAQMLSIVFSHHYWDIGQVKKVDGTPFKTARGAFKNHPCTQWAAAHPNNCAWLIAHAVGLCNEFYLRYEKHHGLARSINEVADLFEAKRVPLMSHLYVDKFARAMPEDLKNDYSIDDVTAYRRYLNRKGWCYSNFKRLPGRRPDWLQPV